MKQLTFIRHAKSDWGNEFLKDIDRPLNETGYATSYQSSGWYLSNKPLPDLIISSTAARALNTALIFARTFNFNMEDFMLEPKVYESNLKNLLLIINNLPNQKNSVIIFGHNPSITNVCNELTDDLFFDNVPTCGIVSLNADVENWADVTAKKLKLNFYQFPKDFKIKD